VAAATARALREQDAGLLLVAGDVRAVQLLRADLAPLVHRGLTMRHVPGGRAPDGSTAHRTAAVAEAVATYATHQTQAMLAVLARHAGPHGTAVYGAWASLRALAAGQVQTLCVVDDDEDERMAWFGSRLLCGGAAATDAAPGRLVDVAVRAALLTGADVRVVEPGTVPEGIAALCRYHADA